MCVCRPFCLRGVMRRSVCGIGRPRRSWGQVRICQGRFRFGIRGGLLLPRRMARRGSSSQRPSPSSRIPIRKSSSGIAKTATRVAPADIDLSMMPATALVKEQPMSRRFPIRMRGSGGMTAVFLLSAPVSAKSGTCLPNSRQAALRATGCNMGRREVCGFLRAASCRCRDEAKRADSVLRGKIGTGDRSGVATPSGPGRECRRDAEDAFGSFVGRVPTISMFCGIAIRIFFDGRDPPHFHAQCRGHDAAFDLDGNILEGTCRRDGGSPAPWAPPKNRGFSCLGARRLRDGRLERHG